MSTTTRTVIRTHNPILATTLRAITVCWWALAADFAHGLVGITRLLWAGYLQARREQLAAKDLGQRLVAEQVAPRRGAARIRAYFGERDR